MTHTPGPWKLNAPDPTDDVFYGTSVSGGRHNNVIASGLNLSATNPQEALANARLIAAAPAMLAALEKARQYVHWSLLEEGTQRSKDVLAAVDVAIAKAKGEA
jgi:hypothetical protein